jgi:hypothetical protein
MSSSITAVCDICSRPVFKNCHFVKLPSTLEVWCHRCFTSYEPSEDRVFNPETDEWEFGKEK